MLTKIFSKRKRKSAATTTATGQELTDKAAMKIVSVIHRMQNRFASFFNKKTKDFSATTWKILIVVFGACWGLFSFCVFSTALLPSAEKSTRSFPGAAPILLPAPIKRNDSLEWMEQIYNARKTIRQLQFDTTDIK